jgi:hypothetical protein
LYRYIAARLPPGPSAAAYNAGLTPKVRIDVQNQWMSGQTQVGLDSTFHVHVHVIMHSKQHGSVDDNRYVHVTNLTPGSE